ncbi:MAG: macro domain-containing protein [Candidatus Coproplasma sp.]
MKLEIKSGSVLDSDAEVIVNAANRGLQAGGGVCGAIFQAAGRQKLQRECNAIGGCETGHAVLTNGYDLNRHVIHAVGPVYHGDQDAPLLESAFLNSLILADSNNFKSIALVPISTGIYGYPLDKAAKIAIDTVLSFQAENLEICYIYCYSYAEYKAFSYALSQTQKDDFFDQFKELFTDL